MCVCRSRLLGLRIMGRTPQITFVKDKSVAKIEEVERLLKIADMGPDHPSQAGSPKLYTKVPQLESFSDMLKLSARRFEKNDEYSRDHGKSNEGIALIENASDSNNMNGSNSNYVNENSTKSCTSNQHQKFSPIQEFKLKHDVYGVDREKLLQQTMLTKSRLKDRQSVSLADTIDANFKNDLKSSTVNLSEISSAYKVKSFLQKENRKKVKQLRRLNIADEIDEC